MTSMRCWFTACVLVTDGDGSLNSSPLITSQHACKVRPRHRRGWESQLNRVSDEIAAMYGASSSPTGMGVSTWSVQPGARQ